MSDTGPFRSRWPLFVLAGSLLFIGAGCFGGPPVPPPVPLPPPPASQAAPPSQVASLGALASGQQPVIRAVGSSADKFALAGGAKLDIPAGAFTSPAQLTVTPFSVALGSASFYASDSQGYVLSTDRELPALGAPLTLEFPNPNKDIVALELVGGGTWKKLDLPETDPLAISVTHFSDNTFVLMKPSMDSAEATPPDASPGSPEKTKAELIKEANDYVKEKANPWERAFLGVDEKGDPKAACEELKALLEANKDKWDFRIPADKTADFGSLTMGLFLFSEDPPSNVSSTLKKYTDAAAATQDKIKEEVLKSTEKLSLADVLKIAVDANGGNVPMGILAANNFLKEETVLGRETTKENLVDPFTGKFKDGETTMKHLRDVPKQAQFMEQNAKDNGGAVVSHLQPWRSTDRSPAGAYDKMGPIYHVFAAMTAATFMANVDGGDLAVKGEELMRATGWTGDTVDHDKGLADVCGGGAGERVTAIAETKAPKQEPVETAPPITEKPVNLLPGACDPKGLDACVNWAWDQVTKLGCRLDTQIFRNIVEDFYLHQGCRLNGTAWTDLASGEKVTGGVKGGVNGDDHGCIERYTPGPYLQSGGYFRTPKEALNGSLRNKSISGCEYDSDLGKQDAGTLTPPIIAAIESCTCGQ